MNKGKNFVGQPVLSQLYLGQTVEWVEHKELKSD
jgi:hypothetical protein